ncbi:DUF4962 domain-containing protein [Vulgatibacter incomptus]|uniref:F5/8 type C domain protein n=1 Tax=Vulgatibacter incomptus TaxID=1391653 RepID=A0A0K1PAX0_9BACT|nr:DUF4962 domain-containing protein [Vulgatibacter incomptus]AKU90652.1 F5/8 type C domain protein [Vulgatibacter incomptus]
MPGAPPPSNVRQRALRLVAAAFVLLAGFPAAAASHPSLLFDRSEISTIRARLDGPLRPIRTALEAGIHYPYAGGNFPVTPDRNWIYFSDRRAIPDSMVAFAFGTIGLDPASSIAGEARTLAKNYLVGICNYPDWIFPETQDGPDPDLNSAHFLFGVSLAYDWLYDSLSESERQRCRDRVAVEGEKVYQAMRRNVWWMPEHLQNHNWINTSSLGMAALAFDGELSFSTQRWLDAAKENLDKVKYVIDLIEGGGWHEGTGYLHYGLDSLIPFSHALSRLRGGPDYADTRIVRDYPAMRRFMMPPAAAHRREYVLWGDFSGFENDNTLLPLFYAGRKYRDGQAMWYAQRFISGATNGRYDFSGWPPSQRGFLLSVLFYDETVAPTAPPAGGAAWNLDYYSKDLSLWESRSGWEDGGAMLTLKTGVYGGRGNWDRLRNDGWPGGYINFGHDHADDMGVHFFADGEWLTTRVPGYWIGRANGAPEANRTKYANSLLVDGQGQLGEGVRDCWMGSCTWFWDRVSSINLRGSTAHYSFAIGAGSKLYPSSMGLTAFGRSVLFLDRRIPVVRDVVRARSNKRFEIVYHAMDGASRDGSWIRLNGKNDRVLGVNVVSPAAFEVRTESQSLVHLDKFDSDGSMTAAMIRPATDTSDTVFLTALVPQRGSNWASGRPRIAAIDPSDPGRGLSLTGLEAGAQLDAVFNEDPGQTSAAAGLSVKGMAGVRKTVNGQVARVMLASGTSLSLDGTPWIEVAGDDPATVEAERNGYILDVTGDERPMRLYAPGATVVRLNGEPVSFSRNGDHVRILSGDTGGGAGGSGGNSGTGGNGGSGGSGGAGGAGGGAGCSAGGAGGNTGGEGGSGIDPGAGGDTGTDPGAGGDTGTDPGAGGDTGTDPGAGGDTGTDPGAGGDTGTDPGAGGDTGTDPGAGGDTGTDPGAGGDTGTDPGAGGDTGTDPGAGGHGGTDHGSGGNDGTDPGTGGAGGSIDGGGGTIDGGTGGQNPGPGDGGTTDHDGKGKKRRFGCDATAASQASPFAFAILALGIRNRRKPSQNA